MFSIVLLATAPAETLMVGVEGPAAAHAVTDTTVALGGTARCWARTPVCVVHFEGAAPLAALSALLGVRYVERDRLMDVQPAPRASSPPNDAEGTEDCPDLWELEKVRATEAWSIVQGHDAPVIAIQDSGFLTTHVEIENRISGQYDYGNQDGDPEVEWGSGVPDHGTFIAGMIAGDPDNGLVRAGLAPYARLNLQKIADDSGALYFSYAVAALADLADGDLGVRVLNYSIGGSTYTSAFRDAFESLEAVGILVVAAAGNCSSPHCSTADNDVDPMYPASFSFQHVVSVASSTRADELNPYSHYGASSVDLAAPGEDLCSCGVYADDNFYTASGTSYATPLVAATAALVLEAHPLLTTTELARVIRASAEELPGLTGKVASGGRLDVYAALQTGVPRFGQPSDAVIDGTGSIVIAIDSAAHEGEGWLVLTHDDAFDVAQAQIDGTPWALATYEPGETVVLPDAGEAQVEGARVTVAVGELPAHGTVQVELTLRGRELGSTEVSARVTMTSEGADYLNAPYDEGSSDVTGFLALRFEIEVTGLTSDTGWPDTGPLDTAVQDSGARDSAVYSRGDRDEIPGRGCGCGTAAPLMVWWAPALLALGRRRRV